MSKLDSRLAEQLLSQIPDAPTATPLVSLTIDVKYWERDGEPPVRVTREVQFQPQSLTPSAEVAVRELWRNALDEILLVLMPPRNIAI